MKTLIISLTIVFLLPLTALSREGRRIVVYEGPVSQSLREIAESQQYERKYREYERQKAAWDETTGAIFESEESPIGPYFQPPEPPR